MKPDSSHIIRDLVNSNNAVREKAHSDIVSWFSFKAISKKEFSYQSMLKIWRGLIRSLWMTDTLEKQDILTNILSKSIIEALGGTESSFSIIYGDAFWNSIALEWEFFDHLRLDKFYLLMRKLAPLTISSMTTFLSVGRKDGKKIPNSIILFIVDNFLGFTEILGTSSEAADVLSPIVRLFLSTTSDVVASRIDVNIFKPLDANSGYVQPFSSILPKLCQEIARSDLKGEIFTTSSIPIFGHLRSSTIGATSYDTEIEEKDEKYEYFKDKELEGPLGGLIGRPYFLKSLKGQRKLKNKTKQKVIQREYSSHDFENENVENIKDTESCNWIPKHTMPTDNAMSEDRRTNKYRLRIMEFNAEWLYLYGGNGAVKCPGIQCPWKNKAEAQEHLTKVAELLTQINADIIYLNELEGCRVIHALISQMNLKSQYKGYLIPGTDTATGNQGAPLMIGQNIAIITKIDPITPLSRTDVRVEYPIEGSKCKSTKKGSISVSKHHITKFRIPFRNSQILNLLILGCHLLAFPKNPLRCSMREAQAHVLRQFVKNSLKKEKAEVIILGDLNDFDDELQVLQPNTPSSRVLKILKASQNPSLENLAQLINIEERFSCWFDKNGNCVDDGISERSLIEMTAMLTRSRALSKRKDSSFTENACGNREHSIPPSTTIRTFNDDVENDHPPIGPQSYDQQTNQSLYGERSIFVPASILLIAVTIGIYFADLFPSYSSSDIGSYLASGLVGFLGLCIFIAMTFFPDGPFIRPNTAIWRLVLGFGLFYLCIIIPFIFIPIGEARQIIRVIFDSSLGIPLPSRSYAENCELSSWSVIWDQLDVFVILHVFGWIFKALIFRDVAFCWILSISFELLEYALQHQLPNFAECWWDHWVLDVLLCNFIGIVVGLSLGRIFSIKPFSWAYCSTFDKKPTSLALSSFKHYVQLLILLETSLVLELTCFYLKHLLWIPTVHPLNACRLLIISLLGSGAVREFYEVFSNGSNCSYYSKPFMALTFIILIAESVVCIRWGQGQFPNPAPTGIKVLAAIIAICVLVVFPMILFSIRPLLNKRRAKIQ